MSPGNQGRVCWYDLMSKDVEASKNFYRELFGWRIDSVDAQDHPYSMIFIGDRPQGGIVAMPGGDIPNHWIPYIAVDDVQKSADQAESLGALVCMPPTDIGPGIYAMINDPQGGAFTLWKGKDPLPEPPTKDAMGVFCWSECLTTDPGASQAFYEDMFGWRTETADMEIGGKPVVYRLLFQGDAHFGGILDLPAEAKAHGAPTHWLNYVSVADADAAAVRAVELGATVIVPCMDIPQAGRFCVIQDPQGAVLALFMGAAS